MLRRIGRKESGVSTAARVVLGLSILVLSLLPFGSCATPPAAVSDLVLARAEPFSAGNLPAGLLEELEPVSVVFLGETHYVAEHQAFMADLASGLLPFGYQLVLQEGMHCDGWAADDYVQGRLEALPPNVAAFDSAWLGRLRAVNAGLPEEGRIHVAYFDMNHFPGEFLDSVRLALRLSASDTLARAARDLLSLDPRSPAYAPAVEAFQRAMDAPAEGLDAKWSRRLAAAAAVELRSLALRRDWNDEAREALIFDLVAGFIAQAPEGKALVNCGMNHAQSRPVLPGPRLAPLRERFAGLPEYASGVRRIFSLATLPLSGQRLAHFYDKAATSFDLLSGSPTTNFLRILGEAAQGRNCYLPLEGGPLGSMTVPWDDGASRLLLKPGSVFDGLITYPKGSIPASLAPLRQ